MTLLGLDLNATRVRAVSGPAGEFPLPVPLDPPALELPLVVILARSKPEIGHAGLRLSRVSPHLVCRNFLLHLDQDSAGRRWSCGRRALDARQLMSLVWQRLRPMCGAGGVVLTLPSHCTRAQVDVVTDLAAQAQVPLLASLPAALALTLAAYAEQPWFGYALVVDVDDHAVTLSTLSTSDGQAQLVETRVYTHLAWDVWRARLLNALADCCVLQSRRDPRDSPAAEQALFEQLDTLLDASRRASKGGAPERAIWIISDLSGDLLKSTSR